MDDHTTTDDRESNDNHPRQLRLDGSPAETDPTNEEIRQNAIDALADCDGAFVVIGTIGDADHDHTNCDDPDCDGEALEILTARFSSDDLDDEERDALMGHLQREARAEAGPSMMGGVVTPDQLPDLLASLGGGDGPFADADGLDPDEDVTYE